MLFTTPACQVTQAGSYPEEHVKLTWMDQFLSTFNILGWVIFLFYFLWGFNYYRPSWIEKHGLTAVYPDSVMLMQEM
ncbi:MAG: DUF3810 family protein, partial [Saprospiraceae bacterium]|nr:DUF3810 family protein [Saprospiraceae bacterium]